jgi:hypothetical protein
MNLRRDNPLTGAEFVEFNFFMTWLIKPALRLSCNPPIRDILHRAAFQKGMGDAWTLARSNCPQMEFNPFDGYS